MEYSFYSLKKRIDILSNNWKYPKTSIERSNVQSLWTELIKLKLFENYFENYSRAKQIISSFDIIQNNSSIFLFKIAIDRLNSSNIKTFSIPIR